MLQNAGVFFFFDFKLERQREMDDRDLPSSVLPPKCLLQVQQGQAKARGQELNPGLICERQGPNDLDYHLLPPTRHSRRKLVRSRAKNLNPDIPI